MLGPISQRILTLLQLTRMALVFTAIADGAAEVLLRAGKPIEQTLDARCLAAMAVTSVGFYGFGMCLNDIIDRRRDSRLAAHRPLPSGRVGVVTAHLICFGLGVLALAGGAAYAELTGPDGFTSLVLVLGTLSLIFFYDFGGKYFVTVGLLSLGVIRFLNAAVAAPLLPVIWHPLLLLDHVAVLSAIAYEWEQKGTPLTMKQRWRLGGILAGLNVLVLAGVAWQRGSDTGEGLRAGVAAAWNVKLSLLIPAAAVVGFAGVAWLVRRSEKGSREAGQKLMLYGLLWLIVYDAAFVAAYVSWFAAGMVLVLLPIAWWSVQFMRWWSKLMSLRQRPDFIRAES